MDKIDILMLASVFVVAIITLLAITIEWMFPIVPLAIFILIIIIGGTCRFLFEPNN